MKNRNIINQPLFTRWSFRPHRSRMNMTPQYHDQTRYISNRQRAILARAGIASGGTCHIPTMQIQANARDFPCKLWLSYAPEFVCTQNTLIHLVMQALWVKCLPSLFLPPLLLWFPCIRPAHNHIFHSLLRHHLITSLMNQSPLRP